MDCFRTVFFLRTADDFIFGYFSVLPYYESRGFFSFECRDWDGSYQNNSSMIEQISLKLRRSSQLVPGCRFLKFVTNGSKMDRDFPEQVNNEKSDLHQTS